MLGLDTRVWCFILHLEDAVGRLRRQMKCTIMTKESYKLVIVRLMQ